MKEKKTVIAQNGYGAKEFIRDIHKSASHKDESATPENVRLGIVGILGTLLGPNSGEGACNKCDKAAAEVYCFSHYLSSNPDFDYLYGYLAHSYRRYRDMLRQVGEALQSVFDDIDRLKANSKLPDEFRVEFDRFLSVSFKGGKPTASFIWDKLDRLYRLKDKYYISAFKGEDLRGTIFRKSKKDIESLIEML